MRFFLLSFDPVLHIHSRAGDTTINAQYTINPNQNEGLNYQYDLVVRNRDERRRLEAGDCECCREVMTEILVYFIYLFANINVKTPQYYAEVGPLPSRLQPLLWRSPPATPAKPCLRKSNSHSPEAPYPAGS